MAERPKCALRPNDPHFACPGGRDADYEVEWTIMGDLSGAQTSFVCEPCWEGRPQTLVTAISVRRL